MEIFIEKEQRTVHLEHEGSVRALLEKLSILPEMVLVVRDGELATEEDDATGARKIELLSVVSGG
jgi:sulfur carrier protein ThiS